MDGGIGGWIDEFLPQDNECESMILNESGHSCHFDNLKPDVL